MGENFIERLQYFMEKEGINDNQMTVVAGLSVGLLGKLKKSGKGMSSVNIEKVLLSYPRLNGDWLLTGRGSMIAEREQKTTPPTTTAEKALRPLVTKALASKPETDVYEVVRREGSQMQQLEAFRQYADFDFYYQVRHDAMAPTYERGDVLALSHLAPDALIEQGAALVIDTRDYGFIFRTVYDQGDHYQCEPINPHSKFKAQQIGKDRVIRLYRVLYSVRWGD